MAEWEDTIEAVAMIHAEVEPETGVMNDEKIRENDVALKNPFSDSIIRIREDGSIDLFADDQLGIRLDKNSQSITFFGDNINIVSNNTKMHTSPSGLSWNNKSPYFEGQGIKMRESLDIQKTQSNELLDILEDLGILTERSDEDYDI